LAECFDEIRKRLRRDQFSVRDNHRLSRILRLSGGRHGTSRHSSSRSSAFKGADEKEAYEYVWRNRKKLGWTKETHGESVVWRNIRRQTQEFAPNLFVCDWNEAKDCTE
jgi:hypothetical protein